MSDSLHVAVLTTSCCDVFFCRETRPSMVCPATPAGPGVAAARPQAVRGVFAPRSLASLQREAPRIEKWWKMDSRPMLRGLVLNHPHPQLEQKNPGSPTHSMRLTRFFWYLVWQPGTWALRIWGKNVPPIKIVFASLEKSFKSQSQSQTLYCTWWYPIKYTDPVPFSHCNRSAHTR